ncbi:MAG: nitrogen fixation protein [Candidatus Thiodiazotropha sp. (ex Lucinoma kastoroae)]|nr:nitrogen fixation protein [Candidatus Thiodiazotropha sp. (ex Rostrolucina anterorostrata)]MCU7847866.1 nitrogen fixation protein [Candidatus Thiodiazotropha sp. (ex Lucinoma kastoroae)]MCU7862115.1 nitrogen fixation protein [Candidatus Thiodiazotropha sp. (ex Lucinoma kastoroae)]
MKIAITSQNFRTITAHAGKCRRFLIFQQDNTGKVIEIDRLDLPKEMSMHEFRGLQHPLFSVDVLITASAGQGFINRMTQQAVNVMVTGEADPYKAAEAVYTGRPLAAAEAHSHSHPPNKPIMPSH